MGDALREVLDWFAGRGLEVVLIVIGSVLLARFVGWVGGRVTSRIDDQYTGGDALVRSEAAKHRHSLTQVITWTAVEATVTIVAATIPILRALVADLRGSSASRGAGALTYEERASAARHARSLSKHDRDLEVSGQDDSGNKVHAEGWVFCCFVFLGGLGV